jgi:DNA-binding IclR family transcriptional regulator
VVGQSTQLGVLDGDEVLFVERLSAPGSVVNFTEIAGRLPLHASSSGQVLLACAPAEVKERVLARPLRVYTPRTVHDERSLRATLADVRARGFAFCPGHIHPDATGLAVPIRSGGQVIASLSLVVPNDENAWSLLRPLQVTAMALGRTLSAPPPVTR